MLHFLSYVIRVCCFTNIDTAKLILNDCCSIGLSKKAKKVLCNHTNTYSHDDHDNDDDDDDSECDVDDEYYDDSEYDSI